MHLPIGTPHQPSRRSPAIPVNVSYGRGGSKALDPYDDDFLASGRHPVVAYRLFGRQRHRDTGLVRGCDRGIGEIRGVVHHPAVVAIMSY